VEDAYHEKALVQRGKPEQARCNGNKPNGDPCDNYAETPTGFCRICAPQSVRDLYQRGLGSADLSALKGLASDPLIRDLSQEIARVRVLLNRTFEKLANIESLDERIRREINEGPLTEQALESLKDLEAIASHHQLTVAQSMQVLEGLRRTIETHTKLQDGRKLVGDITVGDLTAFLRTVILEVEKEAGKSKAKRIAHRIREMSGHLEMGLPLYEH
jgi:hypothetical protein